VFQGNCKLFKVLNDKKYIFSTVNSRHPPFFRASANCSKILKDEKYFNAMKNIRANSVFQGRHKLLKSPECKNYIQHSETYQGKLRFPGQAQVAQKSLKIKNISIQ